MTIIILCGGDSAKLLEECKEKNTFMERFKATKKCIFEQSQRELEVAMVVYK